MTLKKHCIYAYNVVWEQRACRDCLRAILYNRTKYIYILFIKKSASSFTYQLTNIMEINLYLNLTLTLDIKSRYKGG